MPAIGTQLGGISNRQITEQSDANQLKNGTTTQPVSKPMALPADAAYMQAVVPVKAKNNQANAVIHHWQNLLKDAFATLRENGNYVYDRHTNGIEARYLSESERFEFYHNKFQHNFESNIQLLNSAISQMNMPKVMQERTLQISAITCKAMSAFLASISVSNMNERILRTSCSDNGLGLIRAIEGDRFKYPFTPLSVTYLRMKALSSPSALQIDHLYTLNSEGSLCSLQIEKPLTPVLEACKKIIEKNENIKANLKDPAYGRLLSAKLILNAITKDKYVGQKQQHTKIQPRDIGQNSFPFKELLHIEVSKVLQPVSKMLQQALTAETFDETQFTNTMTHCLSDYAKDYNAFLKAFFRIPPDFMNELLQLEKIAQHYLEKLKLTRFNSFTDFDVIRKLESRVASTNDEFLKLDLMSERFNLFSLLSKSEEVRCDDVHSLLKARDQQEFPALFKSGSRRTFNFNPHFELPLEFLNSLCFKLDSPETPNEYDEIGRQFVEGWKHDILQNASVQFTEYDKKKDAYQAYSNEFNRIDDQHTQYWKQPWYIRKFQEDPMSPSKFKKIHPRVLPPERPTIEAASINRFEDVTGLEPNAPTRPPLPQGLKLLTAGDSEEKLPDAPEQSTGVVEEIPDDQSEGSTEELITPEQRQSQSLSHEPHSEAEQKSAVVSPTEALDVQPQVQETPEEKTADTSANKERKRLTKSRPVSVQTSVEVPQISKDTVEKREPNKLKKKESHEGIEDIQQEQALSLRPLGDIVRETLGRNSEVRYSGISSTSNLIKNEIEALDQPAELAPLSKQATVESVSDYEDEPLLQPDHTDDVLKDSYALHLAPSKASISSSLRPQKSLASIAQSEASQVESELNERQSLLPKTENTNTSVRPSLELVGQTKAPSPKAQSVKSVSMRDKSTWTSRLGSIASFIFGLPQRIFSLFSMAQKPPVHGSEYLLTPNNIKIHVDREFGVTSFHLENNDDDKPEEITKRIPESISSPIEDEHDIHVIDFAKMTPVSLMDDFSSSLLNEFERRLSALHLH